MVIKIDTRHKFYATFGVGQVFAQMYVEIIVPEYVAIPREYAREAIVEAFSVKWSMLYDEYEFQSFQKEYRYQKLCTIAPNAQGYYRYAG